jgi:hypothetical protein
MAAGQRPPFPPPRPGEYTEVKRTQPITPSQHLPDPARTPLFLPPELQKLKDEVVADAGKAAAENVRDLLRELFAEQSSVTDKPKKSTSKESKDVNDSNPALTRSEKSNRRLKGWVFLLVSLVGVLGTVSANLWSFVQGYAQDRANRALELEAAKELHDRVEQHESRLGEIVTREESTAVSLRKELGSEIRAMAELQVLEAEYLNAVLEALVARRKLPQKSRRLVDAEAAAQATTGR